MTLLFAANMSLGKTSMRKKLQAMKNQKAGFSWTGFQKGYRHSFDVYQVLIGKHGGNGECKTIDRLLIQNSF
ncbi:hypothetical protein ISN44_As09g009790 [Arabidopsis suecica]|uniref:Uncharacterized protein n=1 Tax=Arabidopsis suecica TaxID=45249 RepID=A0A8T2AGH2_ARASU|nr:hypothetical protein ISN44_As09g009790 [Arabidopsis suecica]